MVAFRRCAIFAHFAVRAHHKIHVIEAFPAVGAFHCFCPAVHRASGKCMFQIARLAVLEQTSITFMAVDKVLRTVIAAVAIITVYFLFVAAFAVDAVLAFVIHAVNAHTAFRAEVILTELQQAFVAVRARVVFFIAV